MAQGVMRARVTRVDVDGRPWVQCPDLGTAEELGPLDVLGSMTGFVASMRVLIAIVGGVGDDLLVVGKIGVGPSTVITIDDLPVATSGEVSSTEVVRADDVRLSDSRTPTGPAGGALSGTYPNPGLVSASVIAAIPNAVHRLMWNGAAYPARPAVIFAEWVGPVVPPEMGVNDTWHNTSV